MLLEASALASKDVTNSEMPKHWKPFAPTLIYTGRTPAGYFLMDDATTQGRLLSALDTVARAKGIPKR